MKKYLLFFAAFALLLVGCAQNEIVENRSEKNLIGFRTLNDKVTKAANDAGSDYGVYAVWSKAAEWFMSNQKVTGGNDNYEPTQYWPGDGDVSFYAYAPYNSANIVKSETAVSGVAVTYTVPDTADEDFTIATPVKNKSGGNVVLNFNHMLTKASVTAVIDEALEQAGFSLDLTAATVDINVSHSTATTDVLTAAVLTPTGADATYNKSLNGTPEFMFIPQETVNGSTSKVSIQLKNVTVKKSGTEYWKGNMKVYDFVGGSLSAFAPNTKYAITFTIKNGAVDGSDPSKPVFGESIVFESSQTDWTDGGDVSINQPDGVKP